MQASAIFPTVKPAAGFYESFYLRAISPREPIGVWIRYTVHKRPGAVARGSLWCTVFDARRGRPFQHKLTSTRIAVPAAGWIAIEGAEIGPGRAHGSCGEVSWRLRFAGEEHELRHLSPRLLYRMPFPRTKLTSPAPAASFEGVIELAGLDAIELEGWPGMVGHNWGSEHAERWIWVHGIAFEDQPRAWLDLALGRVRLGGRLTPWVANGALALDGRRHRLRGLAARGVDVHESVDGCQLRMRGAHGLALEARVRVPAESAAGWRYADPDGGEHDVVNCSVAELELTVTPPGASAPSKLSTAHGGVYELGMRERDHGVPIAPFTDG